MNPIAPQSIAREIRRLRDSVPAPIFIAYPHWGVDYDGVQDYQRAYARRLIDAGVDLIVGHGRPRPSSVETVAGRPVVYGLGNGVWNAPGRFAHLGAPPFGLAAALRLRQDGDRMSAALRLYPLMIDNAVTRFQNRPVSPGELPGPRRAAAREDSARPPFSQGCDRLGHHVEVAVALSHASGEPALAAGGA